MNYVPVTDKDKKEMLEKIGVKTIENLFDVIPQEARIEGLKLPKGISEHSLVKYFTDLSSKNASLTKYKNYCGAGIYEHFIPALVGEIINRSEFSTAYTPYQPEASQGTLQSIFEYQSMIAEITGLDLANASLYDGASAAAEAALLAVRSTGRKNIVVSSLVHPEYRQVIKTYLQGLNVEIAEINNSNGLTSIDNARSMIDDSTACVIIQTPNFFGSIEDMTKFKDLAASKGALLISIVNPVSLGFLKSPGEYGVDVAVGEGQVLGNPSSFGGFSFGFMASKKELSWKMPGRIVGKTTDTKGRRGFVLTLQAREQHIKREKATSNICTNAALNALAGCVYMSGWGAEGLKELGNLNILNSTYAYEQISKVPGFFPAFEKQVFFNEFVIKTNKDLNQINNKLFEKGIIGPLELKRFYPEHSNALLFCVTETKTKADIDELVKALKEI